MHIPNSVIEGHMPGNLGCIAGCAGLLMLVIHTGRASSEVPDGTCSQTE
jgi:hypothetical protein